MQTKAANQKFIALSDPARLDIVRHLAQGSKTAGELAVPFKVSRPAISRHLRVLREAGIARAEVRGREWWYTLEPSTLSEIQVYLEEVKDMWRANLKAFKNYVEEQP
ncbi:MAG TPA: metalloregulator ArsR/SmtB family transcription factor [Anaerolineales bacterium]|nr:metalloregulator ArsR/SmtB family transcription factor [Anaerolineales bacterium]